MFFTNIKAFIYRGIREVGKMNKKRKVQILSLFLPLKPLHPLILLLYRACTFRFLYLYFWFFRLYIKALS